MKLKSSPGPILFFFIFSSFISVFASLCTQVCVFVYVYGVYVVVVWMYFIICRFDLLESWIEEYKKQRQVSIKSTTTYKHTYICEYAVWIHEKKKVVDPKDIYILIEECHIHKDISNG